MSTNTREGQTNIFTNKWKKENYMGSAKQKCVFMHVQNVDSDSSYSGHLLSIDTFYSVKWFY